MLPAVKVPNPREERMNDNLCTAVSTSIITAAFQTGQLLRPLTKYSLIQRQAVQDNTNFNAFCQQQIYKKLPIFCPKMEVRSSVSAQQPSSTPNITTQIVFEPYHRYKAVHKGIQHRTQLILLSQSKFSGGSSSFFENVFCYLPT